LQNCIQALIGHAVGASDSLAIFALDEFDTYLLMTVIGDGSVKDDGFAAVWTTNTVAADDGGVVEIRLY